MNVLGEGLRQVMAERHGDAEAARRRPKNQLDDLLTLPNHVGKSLFGEKTTEPNLRRALDRSLSHSEALNSHTIEFILDAHAIGATYHLDAGLSGHATRPRGKEAQEIILGVDRRTR